MAFMEKLREGTLADAIEKFARQSQQQSAASAKEEDENGWDHAAMAPGHSLRDFLRDEETPSTSLSSTPLRETRAPQSSLSGEQELTLSDRRVPGSVPGVCGLVNMGNTCYMNAGLQCIRSIPEIAYHYLGTENGSSGQSTTSHKDALSSRLSILLHKLWSGLFSVVNPQAFKITLGVLHPQFNGNRQQDCQEFLAMLLDTLHEEYVARETSVRVREEESEPCDERGREEGSVAGDSGSVITHTFRGALRNEVVCLKCGHKSTKEEPFFYLSVPLPHAFDRQIYVWWMPLPLRPGTRKSERLLVTVSKLETVAVFKTAVINLIGRPLSHDLVQIAEVKDNTIVRILANSVSLKQLDDKKFEVFAFELSPLLSGVSETMATQGEVTKREGEGEGEREREREGEGEREEGKEARDCLAVNRKHSKESDSEAEGLPTKMFKSDGQSSPREGTSPVINTTDEPTTSIAAGNPAAATEKGDAPVLTKAVVVEWHSCAICLEEMVDSELVTHATCGAVLCSPCLQSSVDHYQKEGGLVPCPICSAVVKSSEAFTPLAQQSDSDAVTKLLQTTVLFRTLSTDSATTQCVAPPAILRLPETATGLDYCHMLSPFLPLSLASSNEQWTLCLTDTKGRFCSRCTYGSGCRGCAVSLTDSHSLRPGDYLAVTLVRCEGVMCDEVRSHPSLGTKRESTLSLEECLTVFSQREELVGDNHWLCPSCDDFQSASRTLFVSSLPQTVIIHLKRFVYHGTSGSKIDAPVRFPLELDPQLVSHDCHVTQPLQLAACVCHFGTLNCGHYTAYVRHMQTEEWTYCNDETVTARAPSDKDDESVYILFYRRRDIPAQSLPSVDKSFDDAAEMSAVTRLLRQHKPRPTNPDPPSRLKRSNSTGDMRQLTLSSSLAVTETIAAQTSQLLESLGISPDSATIAHTLPQAPPIIQAESMPHSPPPPMTPPSLLTPPPSNSSSTSQTTPIVEDYMNYIFSDDIIPPVAGTN